MNQVKNIIFDLGGVLINLNYNATEEKFKSYGLDNFNELYSQAQQNQLFDLFETGKISSNEFINQLTVLSGNHLNKTQIITAWNAMLKDFPFERIDFLESVKNNYNIFLLSNTNEIHINAFIENLNQTFGYNRFTNCFKKIYYSYEIGLRKPNKEIFNFVLEDQNINKEETVFIDDSEQHVIGANSCGIKSFLLNTSNNDVINLLKQEGLWK